MQNTTTQRSGGKIVAADKKEVGSPGARYAVGFRPINIADDEKFRPVLIKIASAKPRKEKLVVLTKRGHYLRLK
jgi:hypothetical protein